jgi:uncharacterized membrane protein
MQALTRKIIYVIIFVVVGFSVGFMIGLAAKLPIFLSFVWEQLATAGVGNLILLIIAICGALGVLGYTVAAPKIGERYTEFYILGIKGKAQDYPTEFTMANGKVTSVMYSGGTVETTTGSGTLTVGIVSHEQQSAVYSVVVIIFDDQPVNVDLGGTIIDMLGPVELQQGEKWEKQIGIAPRRIGDNEKVEFRLFKGDSATPENTLHLWINVKAAR